MDSLNGLHWHQGFLELHMTSGRSGRHQENVTGILHIWLITVLSFSSGDNLLIIGYRRTVGRALDFNDSSNRMQGSWIANPSFIFFIHRIPRLFVDEWRAMFSLCGSEQFNIFHYTPLPFDIEISFFRRVLVVAFRYFSLR